MARTLKSAAPMSPRRVEAFLLCLVGLLAALGSVLASLAGALRLGQSPPPVIPGALLLPAALALSLFAIHWLFRRRGFHGEQLILPCVGLLSSLGFIMVWRLLPPAFAWQQLVRGWIPGMLLVAVFVARPDLVERIRRDWPMTISLAGLGLLLATAAWGRADASGARLSLKLGPLPAMQTSEPVKLALIIFLAWYIERVGAAAEGRARPWGWFRLPAVQYLLPGTLYLALAMLALFRMADLGAVLILGGLFLTLLYAGFEPRVFLPVVLIGLGLSLAGGLSLVRVMGVPPVLQLRWAAYLDPWSRAPLLVNGAATGLTVSAGPGYQVQQAAYSVMSGGLTGRGLGFGMPGLVPLAHSDFVFAALVEEMGAAGGLAVLAFFGVLFLRILRTGARLPAPQVFERLLLVGIGAHLFLQVFVMVGGTLNLLPVTGLTVPFLSHGGTALLVNLTEAGLALALAQRLEAPRQ